MTPQRVREYVLILTLDLMPCFVGVYIPIYALATHQLQAWMLPLVAGCLGVPLLRPRGSEEDLDDHDHTEGSETPEQAG